MARVAVVTGGTRGIGARDLEGAARPPATRSPPITAATTRPRRNSRPRPASRCSSGTCRRFDACAEGVKKVEAELGPVEVLVNNAGITRDATLHRMKPEQWNAVINTNLGSLFNMCRQVIEGMRERKFGRIVNISSINGQKGQMGQTNYSAAKAGEHRLHQGAGAGRRARRHHRQRDLPGLHQHRDGAGGAEGRAGEDRSCR